MVEEVGSVCVIREEKIFEWKINDFLQIKNFVVRSPKFCFSDASWKIDIYPSEQMGSLIGCIILHVFPVLLPKPLTVNMTLSLKTVDGKKDLEAAFTKLIDEKYIAFQRHIITYRSNLTKRKSELLPSDALTVICTLKKGEPSIVNEHKFLDVSIQTEKITECKLPEASSQTEEGTGIWKLQQHLREISQNGDASDVILKVGDQEFKSHRCILAARSPVFSAMMKNKMKENVTGVVDIEDVDPKTFSIFLNYLYTGSTKYLTSENVAKLYTAADMYQVQVLKENCLDYMLVNVSAENFCDVFAISLQHNEEELKETCFKFFGKHFLGIIQTCKWQIFLCENPITANELLIKHIQLNKDFYALLSKQ